MIAAAPPRTSDAGFTLIEVLAALTIAAVVTVATVALIHDVALNFDRGTRTASNADRLLLAIERLTADFASARLVTQAGQGTQAGQSNLQGTEAMVAFVGQPTGVRFVAAGGATVGPKGEEVVGLTVEQSDGLTYLVRRRGKWLGPRTAFADLTLDDPVQLLEGTIDVAFAYGSVAPDGAVTWNATWTGRPLLPRLVRLTIQDHASGTGLIPAQQFVLRADAPMACAEQGAEAKCLGDEKADNGKPAKDAQAGARR